MKKMFRSPLMLLLALGMMVGMTGLFAGPAVAQESSPVAAVAPVLPATVTDAAGDTVEVTDVSRIIPLNGNVAETLFALGLGPNVVAVDVSALYPAEALALPKLATSGIFRPRAFFRSNRPGDRH